MAQLKETDFQQDILDIAQIPIITTILDVVCQNTGMGFAAVARVTEDRWIACSVRDDIGFGLKPGGELEVKTTICSEIRESHKKVVFDHASENPLFKNHHTPIQYGIESYISVPIIRKDGSFFGTLCAIDPRPNKLDNPTVTGTFDLFADLISFHLDALEHARLNEIKLKEQKNFKKTLEKEVKKRTQELKEYNISLEKMNKDLQAFAYISSHDLQEPLRKIQTIASIISEKEFANLSKKGKDYFERLKNAAERMQALINDLLAYSRTTIAERNFEDTDLGVILTDVKEDLAEELKNGDATIVSPEMCRANIIPFQFRQLLYNLLSNSIKFKKQETPLVITITSRIVSGDKLNHKELDPKTNYCHISVSDNGIGFDPKFNDRIFELFKRLNDKKEYIGTGIGLAIVKRIVENHDGFITANGKPGEGAAFDIYLPIN